MASIDLTRPKRRPAHAGRLPLFSAKPPMRWAAALGVLVCVLVAGLAVHGGGEGPSSSGQVPDPGARREAARGSSREASRAGRPGQARLFRLPRLAQADAGRDLAGRREAQQAGSASRTACRVPTAYGRETIVVDSTGTEQFLTVERRQGKHDWQWRLDTDAQPRLQPDGSILYGAGLARTPPVAILDAGGKDVTPDGLRWSLRRAGRLVAPRPAARRLEASAPVPRRPGRRLPLPALPLEPGLDRDRILEADHGGAGGFQRHDEHHAGPERDRLLPLDPGRGEHDCCRAPGEPHRHGLGAGHCRRHGLPHRQLGLHGHDRHPRTPPTWPGPQSSTSASGRGRSPAESSRRPALSSRRPTIPRLRTSAPP